MTTVRPPAFPPIRTPEPPRNPAATGDSAKLAAQRAFFQAALGQAAPAAAPQKISEPSAARVSAAKMPDPTAEKPQKILRPGSLLDIRV